MHVNKRKSNNLVKYGIAGVLVLAVLVAVTYPLWIPYFVDEYIDEGFPTSNAEQQAVVIPTEDNAVAVAPTTERNPPAAEIVIENTPIPPTAETATEPLALVQGSFIYIDAVHNGEGTATIYELADGSRILRLEDFQVTNGPDLHVVLSPNAPDSLIGGVGDYLNLGALKANIGNQNYDILADVDLSAYQSVVIYCVPFNVVFSSATLNPIP